MKYKEHGDAHRGHPQGSSREGTGSPGAGTPVARHSRDTVPFSRTARSTSLGSMFGGTATQACVAISSAQPKTQTGCTARTSPRSGREPQHCTVPPLPSKSVTRFFFSAPCLVSHPAPSASRPARPPLRGWLRHRCRHLHRSGQPSRSRGRREGSRLALVTCNPPSSAPAAPGHTTLPCTPPQPHHAPPTWKMLPVAGSGTPSFLQLSRGGGVPVAWHRSVTGWRRATVTASPSAMLTEGRAGQRGNKAGGKPLASRAHPDVWDGERVSPRCCCAHLAPKPTPEPGPPQPGCCPGRCRVLGVRAPRGQSAGSHCPQTPPRHPLHLAGVHPSATCKEQGGR